MEEKQQKTRKTFQNKINKSKEQRQNVVQMKRKKSPGRNTRQARRRNLKYRERK